MRTRLPALAFALFALALSAPTIAAPPTKGPCWLLDSTQAAHVSPGGLAFLEAACSPPAVGAFHETPLHAAIAVAALDGHDVLVNDRFADSGNSTTQSETAIEECGGTLLAAWVDSGSAPGGLTGYARSTDSGASWTDMGAVPGLTGSDPVLTADAQCRFYFAALTLIGPCSAIGVVRSGDGGLAWTPVANASPGTACDNFQDKPGLAVDTSGGPHNGTVYACWDDRGSSEIRVLLSHSTDAGASFSAPIVVASFPSGYATGCQVRVAPDGTLHVVYNHGQALTLFHRSSADGGATLGPETPIDVTFLVGSFVDCGGGQFRNVLNGDIRAFNWPAFAVHPQTGTLHVAWNDSRNANSADILWSRSTDGGATWSDPVRLNDDDTVTDQFQPALAFSSSGVLRAAWYDRRLDPGSNFMIDVFSRVSPDDGASFLPSERITDVSFGVPPLNPNVDPGVSNCFMGDYIGIDADSDTHYIDWGDNRNALNSHPDPDVFFDRRTVADVSLHVTRGDDPPPDACFPGDCSLREAVLLVNATLGAHTITLPAGEYNLEIGGEGDDLAATGDLDIAGRLTLKGAGADDTIIDGERVDRILHVLEGGSLTIDGVTLERGLTVGTPGGPDADGGGILNLGELTLQRVVVSDSVATRAGDGGGIENRGSLTLIESTIAGNGAAFDGGGVHNTGTLTAVNSTFSRNRAEVGQGGGIANSATVRLTNVTLWANDADLDGAPGDNLWNAIFGTLELTNTIVAGGQDANCTGPVQSLGHNIDDGVTCGLASNGDLSNADPFLLPLAHNGGPTTTHRLSPASPAVDAGDRKACPPGDQRGYIRPVDGSADKLAACDIGAFELDSRPLGDADCDFDLDALDGLALLRLVAGQPEAAPCAVIAGDTDCDGDRDAEDALAALRAVAALPVARPGDCPPLLA